jgi:menaquinone-specific isochorismate synthase
MTAARGFKVRTVPVKDPGDLLAALHDSCRPLAWVRRGDGLIGVGETATITVPAGPGRFGVAGRLFRGLCEASETEDRVGLPGCGLVAFGSFTFDAARSGSVVTIPRTVIGRRSGAAWVTTITAVGQREQVRDERPPVPAAEPRGGGLAAAEWEQAVATAVRRIRAGALRKVVLARDLRVTAPAPIDVAAALKVLADRDPDCYVFACAGLVGATPELLIQREGRQIRSQVIAGTAARGSGPAEDAAMRAALAASVKETEEHRYAVESVSEALAPLCADVTVDAAPSVIRLADTHHLATAIRGRLSAPVPVLELAGLMHPTAAVCGTPPDTAMAVIKELEWMDRGRYAGPVGWMDAHGDGEWGLALHCGEIGGYRARLFAGCGIVAGSDAAAELAEAKVKFQPMLRALGLSPDKELDLPGGAMWPSR